MKKLIAKYWLINVLISIILFIIYRIVIAEKEYADGNWLGVILNILDIFLNLGLSLIYLVAMLVCSMTFFMNLNEKIRNHFYISLLTFIGIPFIGVGFLAINVFIEWSSYGMSFLTTFLILSIVYLIFTTLQFLLFRKQALVISKKIRSQNDF